MSEAIDTEGEFLPNEDTMYKLYCWFEERGYTLASKYGVCAEEFRFEDRPYEFALLKRGKITLYRIFRFITSFGTIWTRKTVLGIIDVRIGEWEFEICGKENTDEVKKLSYTISKEFKVKVSNTLRTEYLVYENILVDDD